jgi:hypothetical protein
MVVDTMLLPHGDRLRTAVELPLNRAVRPAFVEQEGGSSSDGSQPRAQDDSTCTGAFGASSRLRAWT